MESRFRAANERIASQARDLGYEGWVPFICECTDDRCVQIISVAIEEFDGIVSSGSFLTFPGHRGPRDVMADREEARGVDDARTP
jgi:hypothetical protein